VTAPPLDGILVVDLSRILAGPSATMMLADLGARVIKVERQGTGDDTRLWGPPWAGSSSSYFESANRSKESIALDFADPDDLRTANQLIVRADVVVQNYRAGALTRFGLDAASVRARNPRVIYLSITGFGSEAGAGIPGYDFLVQALGGLMSITGEPDGAPTKVGVAVVDLLTAKDAVMGILAALLHRERTGEGQHLEVELMTSAVTSLANQAAAYLATGEAPARLGNRHPSIAPYDALRCRDGYLALTVGNERMWASVATVFGDPALVDDPRFGSNADRVAHRGALVERLESHLVREDVAVWAERLLAVGVPAGKVNDVPEALELAQRFDSGLLLNVGPEHPPQLRHPVRYSGFAPVSPVAPPALDEHGERIRAWLDSDPPSTEGT
jgi:crotonobetainyl-CoA:carnitine CoA-transferase CaiB-like acyl-CoA transferase